MLKREDYQKKIQDAKRIVVKVGTSTLTHDTGKLNFGLIEKLVRNLADLHSQNKEIILVTSGAVGAGMGKLGYQEKPKTIPEKQACSAVGQGVLIHIYEKFFSEYGEIVAQLLLTRADIVNRKRFLNARNTLLTLMKKNVIPIINENDTVAVEEFKFGDNDTLASLVAGLVDADLVILLTDTDGLYTSDPRKNKDAKLMNLVEKISPEIEALAGGEGSKFGSGGMTTKVSAAKIAVNAGIDLIIAKGEDPSILAEILEGKDIGTLFISRDVNPHSRKKWLAFASKTSGKVIVDKGAREAILKKGKSLLPSGIKEVEGNFSTGNVVIIKGEDEKEFARGIVNFSSKEIEIIKGKQCSEIINLLGYQDYDEVIHRDNLAIRF